MPSACVADGADACRVERADSPLYALLIPDVQGKLLLLVDVGLPFGEGQGAAAPEPVEEVEEDEEYAYFDLNGRKISFSGQTFTIMQSMGLTRWFTLRFTDYRSIVQSFSLELPSYTQAGDVFRSTKKEKADHLWLSLRYASEQEGKTWASYTANSNDCLRGDDDYFTVTVESLEEDDERIVMVLSFEGVFNKGADKIENGKMRAIVDNK